MRKEQKERIRQLTHELSTRLAPSERHLTEDILRLFGEVRRELASIKREKDSVQAVCDKQTERLRSLEDENTRLSKDAVKSSLLLEENAELYGEIGEQWGSFLNTIYGATNKLPLPCVNSSGVEKLLAEGRLSNQFLVQTQTAAFLDWIRTGEPPVRIMEIKGLDGMPDLVVHTGAWYEGEPTAVRVFTVEEYLQLAPHNVMMLPEVPDSPVANRRTAIIDRGSRR